MEDWNIGLQKDTGIVKKIRTLKKEEIETTHLHFLANRARMNIVEMVHRSNSGHPGGPLGLADIYTYLMFKVLNYKVNEPNWAHRDRFLISNGHVCAGRYAVMALAGIIDESELGTFRQLGSRLQGHPSTKFLPSVENSSGSLGQGLSNAGGLALGLHLEKSSAQIYLGMSDGECQEGMVWEAAMAIAHRGLNNLHPFLDWNNIQIDGKVEDVMALGDLEAKFVSFNWEVQVANGHDFAEIESAFEWAQNANKKPRIILFKTTLGKGVSFMENNPAWHGNAPNKEKRDLAMQELLATRKNILI